MKKTIVRLLTVFLFLTAMTAAAPDIPERQEFETAVNVPLFARLDLPASDGVRCILTTVPAKGALLLREDGFFVYTPKDGRRGRD